jgi:hypothetical protein
LTKWSAGAPPWPSFGQGGVFDFALAVAFALVLALAVAFALVLALAVAFALVLAVAFAPAPKLSC